MNGLIFILVAILVSPTSSCSPFMQDAVSADTYPNFRVQFVDDQTGWIIGPRLFRTVDGGRTWTVIKYARAEDAIRADDGPEYRKYYVQFVDRDWGWRCSPFDLNAVEYTENGGRSWSEPVKISDDSHRAALVFISRDYGWTLGTKVFVTRDRGRTWHEETTLAGLDLKYPYFLNQDYGWIANEWGVIARTIDGGKNWSIERTPLKQVRGIFFITPMQGWVVGDDGLIASTSNGGVEWATHQAPVPYDSGRKMHTTLLDMFFQSPNAGWIVGYDGTVLTTTDGGQTWVRVPTPTHAPLSSIRFVDALRGWAVGGNAEPAMPSGQPSNVVIETTDGGKTWRTKSFS